MAKQGIRNKELRECLERVAEELESWKYLFESEAADYFRSHDNPSDPSSIYPSRNPAKKRFTLEFSDDFYFQQQGSDDSPLSLLISRILTPNLLLLFTETPFLFLSSPFPSTSFPPSPASPSPCSSLSPSPSPSPCSSPSPSPSVSRSYSPRMEGRGRENSPSKSPPSSSDMEESEIQGGASKKRRKRKEATNSSEFKKMLLKNIEKMHFEKKEIFPAGMVWEIHEEIKNSLFREYQNIFLAFFEEWYELEEESEAKSFLSNNEWELWDGSSVLISWFPFLSDYHLNSLLLSISALFIDFIHSFFADISPSRLNRMKLDYFIRSASPFFDYFTVFDCFDRVLEVCFFYSKKIIQKSVFFDFGEFYQKFSVLQSYSAHKVPASSISDASSFYFDVLMDLHRSFLISTENLEILVSYFLSKWLSYVQNLLLSPPPSPTPNLYYFLYEFYCFWKCKIQQHNNLSSHYGSYYFYNALLLINQFLSSLPS